MKMESLNHPSTPLRAGAGHKGTQRTSSASFPLCTFVSFVVNGFSSAESKSTEVQYP